MSVSFSTITQKARLQPVAATSAALRKALTYLPPTTVSKIPNGVRVACEENPNAKFATVGIWLDVGTKNETRETNGLMKVLEQASLQGTRTHDRAALAQALDEIGGHLMVQTGREHSYFAVKCARENVGKAVGVLASIVRDARLTPEDIKVGQAAAEKTRQQGEELNDELVMDNLHVCAYDATENGGLGLSVKGTEDGIKAVTRDSIEQFKKTHFTASRMMLVGAGGVKHGELEAAAQQYLGDVADAKKPAPNSRYVGGDFRLWNLRMKLAHVAWGFETCGAASGDTTALQLATHIHGSFHRSQHELGQHAIHRAIKVFSSMDFGTPTQTPFPEQAPETVTSFLKQYEDTGLCGMYFVARPWATGPGWAGSVHDILQYTMLEWSRLAQKAIHDQELTQAKVNMKSQLLFNQDGSTNTFEDIGRQVFHYGRRVPLDEMYARIDDITATNMQEVLQHYYYGRRPVMSCNGYLYIIPGYDNIVHWTYKFWY